MITLTPFERALHRALVTRARSANADAPLDACMSYGELCAVVDPDATSNYPMTRPPFRGLNEALGHVSMYEAEHGRPLLTALVVQQDSRHPGPGFARLGRHLGFEVDDEDGFWRRELAEVVRFWALGDQVLVLDAAVDRIIEEIRGLKQLVRKSAGANQHAS